MAHWYQDGLAFQCTQCGRCCGGGPGVVWVDREEIRRIAAFLEVNPDDMWGPMLRRVGITRVTLTECSNFDCTLLRRTHGGEVSCSVYSVRPQQCRTWPFWPRNLASRAAWEQAAAVCPGMNQGMHHDHDRIEAIRAAAPWYQQPEQA